MSRILVTGASSGLGLLSATALADAGHEVVLHARRRARAENPGILDRMLGVVYGDLSDLDEVREVAERVDRLGRFDAVIHNAGVMDASAALAVNVAAPYALSALMERPDRVIVLSSSMHRSGSPRVSDAFGRGGASYSDAKLFETALAFALARRWPEAMAHAVDPGWVPTRMGGRSAPDSLEEGHRTQEWLATAGENEIEPRSGGYWHHMAARRAHPAAYETGFQDELLEALRRRTGITLPE